MTSLGDVPDNSDDVGNESTGVFKGENTNNEIENDIIWVYLKIGGPIRVMTTIFDFSSAIARGT